MSRKVEAVNFEIQWNLVIKALAIVMYYIIIMNYIIVINYKEKKSL